MGGDSPTVISVSIGGEAARVATLCDATVQLTATVTMSDDSTSNEVTWSSSAEGVATVSTGGLVTFVAAGDVDITAMSTVDTTRVARVFFTVNPAAVSSISIIGDITRVTTVDAADVQLTATVTMSDDSTSNEVFWSSSAEGVATVSTGGLVTFVAAGDVDITAMSTVDTTRTATVFYTVKLPSLSGTLVFADKAVIALTGDTHNGTVNLGDLTAGTDYELSISPPVTGMTIDNTGVITIPGRSITTDTDTYTVTATGRGNYMGTVEDTFDLVVAQNTLSLDFVDVVGGRFLMGSPDTEAGRENDEGPVHTVTVSDFYMSKYEITFAQYDAYVAEINDENTVPSPDDEDFGGGTRPVINVNWYDAIGFLNWLSAKDGLTSVYTINGTSVTWDPAATGYRLPTESEWEYAARGGENSQGYLYSGSDTAKDVGWYNNNSGEETHPVGGKAPNELGLYDMSGNAAEWCWDWHGYYSSDSQTDPTGQTGPGSDSRRAWRGGSWLLYGHATRSASRDFSKPSYRGSFVGFRLVRRR